MKCMTWFLIVSSLCSSVGYAKEPSEYRAELIKLVENGDEKVIQSYFDDNAVCEYPGLQKSCSFGNPAFIPTGTAKVTLNQFLTSLQESSLEVKKGLEKCADGDIRCLALIRVTYLNESGLSTGVICSRNCLLTSKLQVKNADRAGENALITQHDRKVFLEAFVKANDSKQIDSDQQSKTKEKEKLEVEKKVSSLCKKHGYKLLIAAPVKAVKKLSGNVIISPVVMPIQFVCGDKAEVLNALGDRYMLIKGLHKKIRNGDCSFYYLNFEGNQDLADEKGFDETYSVWNIVDRSKLSKEFSPQVKIENHASLNCR